MIFVMKKETGEAITLQLLTWNIHAGIGWRGLFDPEGLIALIRRFRPDLCGLQEVDCRWSKRSRFESLNLVFAEGLEMYPLFSPSLSLHGGAYGNLILSKYPPVSGGTKLMPGFPEPRSFCWMELLLHERNLTFLTTHLGLSKAERFLQMKQIRGFLKTREEPFILTGDFNADAQEENIQRLGEGLMDLHHLAPWTPSGTFRMGDGRIGPRIDYILASPQFCLESYQVVDTELSDHLPVVARVSLPKR